VPTYPSYVLIDDGTSIASSLVASGSIATRYAVVACGRSTAARDQSGNTICRNNLT